MTREQRPGFPNRIQSASKTIIARCFSSVVSSCLFHISVNLYQNLFV